MEAKYEEWCGLIAEHESTEDLVSHLREHVSKHYHRHSKGGEAELRAWLISAINLAHILHKKFPNIRAEDLLFKLCTYHKKHDSKPAPSFDVDAFLEDYQGNVKGPHDWKGRNRKS